MKLDIGDKMPEVKIYSKSTCPFCVRTKKWFEKNNVEYTEILLDKPTTELKKAFFNDAPGARTVPQIIIDGKYIGGYEDGLMANEDLVRRLLGLL